jgi:hypothetical protein
MPVDVQAGGGLMVVKGRSREAKGGARFREGVVESWIKWNDRLARVRDAMRPVRRERHALVRRNI